MPKPLFGKGSLYLAHPIDRTDLTDLTHPTDLTHLTHLTHPSTGVDMPTDRTSSYSAA